MKRRRTGKNVGKLQEKYRKTGENDENIGKQRKTGSIGKQGKTDKNIGKQEKNRKIGENIGKKGKT